MPVLTLFIDWALWNAINFLFSPQSHKVFISLVTLLFSGLRLHSSFRLLFFSFSHFFLFPLLYLWIDSKTGAKCRVPLVSAFKFHANHGREWKRWSRRGENVWFWPNLATWCGSFLVRYCASRTELTPSLTPSSFSQLHLHDSKIVRNFTHIFFKTLGVAMHNFMDVVLISDIGL